MGIPIRPALFHRLMAAHESVFMPNQDHHEDVEHGKHDQSGSVGVGEAVKLIDDKESQDDQRCRIRPELVPEQTDDQEQFDDAVAKEIKGVEILGLN